MRPGHPRVSGPGRPEGGAVGGRSAPWTPSRLGRRRSHPTALLAPSALSLRINIDKRSFHIVTQASSAAPGPCRGTPESPFSPGNTPRPPACPQAARGPSVRVHRGQSAGPGPSHAGPLAPTALHRLLPRGPVISSLRSSNTDNIHVLRKQSQNKTPLGPRCHCPLALLQGHQVSPESHRHYHVLPPRSLLTRHFPLLTTVLKLSSLPS